VRRLRPLGLALFLTVAACGSKQTPHPPLFARVVAVLPFDTAPSADRGEKRGEAKAGDLVTAQVYRFLGDQTTYLIVPDITVVDTLATPELRRALGPHERAAQLGKAVGADGVIFGRVDRFDQRVGTAYGASQGASVKFSMGLVSVATGEVVWEGEFEETQESLSANFFDWWISWDAGPRWLSASELAGLGVDKLLKECQASLTPERDDGGAPLPATDEGLKDES
jgi:Peptidoglycan-synthase activator LpoB